jgi:hypothetical protein
MAQQIINLSNPNDDQGDDLRTGGGKINDNFTELYAQVTPQYLYSIDPISTRKLRMGVRDSMFVVDKELTATGFAGTESTDDGATGDWINIYYSN